MNQKYVRLYRNRIAALFERLSNRPLTIVTGESGSGKSTAIMQYVQQCKDCRPLIFKPDIGTGTEEERYQSFCATLKLYDGAYQKLLASIPCPLTVTEFRRLSAVLNKQITTPTMFVFDMQQNTADWVFAHFLSELVQDCPQKLRMILVQRSAMPGTPYLCAKGLCEEIRAGELFFTRQELCQVLRLNSVVLTDPQIDALLRYSCGWPQAIRECIDRLRAGDDAFLSAPCLGELWENWALTRLSPADIRLSARLSLLHGLTMEQAETLFGKAAAPEQLTVLYERKAYLDRDERGIFRVNEGARDFFQEQCTLHDEERRLDALRAGQLYAACGRPAEAFDMFVRAGAYMRAMNIYRTGIHVSDLAEHTALICDAMSAIPLSIRLEHRTAYLNYLFNLIFTYEPELGATLLWEARQAYHELQWDAPDYDRLCGELALLEALLCGHDLDTIVAKITEAYANFHGEGSIILGIEAIMTGGTSTILPHFLINPGELEDVYNKLLPMSDMLSEIIGDTAYVLRDVLTTEYLVETGHCQEAKERALSALNRCRDAHLYALYLVAVQTYSRILVFEGLFEEAMSTLLHADLFLSGVNSPELRQGMAICMERMMTHMGYQSSYRRSVDLGYTRYPSMHSVSAVLRVTRSLNSGEPPLRVYENVARNRSESDRLIGLIHLETMHAAVLPPEQAERAVDVYMQAVEMARPDHLIQLFVECTQFCGAMLTAALRRYPEDAFLREIAETSGNYLTRVLSHRVQQNNRRRVLNKTERMVLDELLRGSVQLTMTQLRIPIRSLCAILGDCMEYYGVLSIQKLIDVYREDSTLHNGNLFMNLVAGIDMDEDA